MLLEQHLIRDFSDKSYTKEEFLEQLKYYDENNFNIYIGTDSKIVKDQVVLVSAICFHKPGASGRIFYLKEKVSRKKCNTLRTRMLLEAYRSLEVAMIIDEYYVNHLEIHLDIGSTIKSKTSAYEQELTNLIVSQGYNCVIKPDSWASSSVADKVSR